MCHNAKTGVTATLATIIFEPKTAAIHERQTRFALGHHQNTSSNKNQIFVFLPDTLAVRLLSPSFALTFASSSCLIYKFISKHNMRNVVMT